MARQVENQAPGDRPAYEAPRAMRLLDASKGAGACDPQGSGDDDCMDGNHASPWCDTSGSSAVECLWDGSSPTVICLNTGSGVVEI